MAALTSRLAEVATRGTTPRPTSTESASHFEAPRVRSCMAAVQQNHVILTWRDYKATAPLRLLCDAWPHVLPVPGGGLETSSEPLPPSRSSRQAWISSLAAFDELRSYTDFSTLLRRSVELLREAIGLERAAVFLLGADQRLTGTFGTGTRGETTDERHIAFDVGQSHREAFALSNQGLSQWSRFAGVPLFAQQGERTVIVRTGENIIVPIPGRGDCIGLIACDWGLTGSAADTDALLRTAVFARILSPLLLPWLGTVHQESVLVGGSAAKQLAGAAVRRLRVDPNEDRHAMAKALGTTADRLGRVFKAEMGETLPDYRNRLRLQRFFSIVDAGGGNLLRAALDAGFGSYAQFHRVFHQRFDCAPLEYLRRHGQTRAVERAFDSHDEG